MAMDPPPHRPRSPAPPKAPTSPPIPAPIRSLRLTQSRPIQTIRSELRKKEAPERTRGPRA
jgi:hypothetical protein